jgi:hypothetical protein
MAASHTGRFLAPVLAGRGHLPPVRRKGRAAKAEGARPGGEGLDVDLVALSTTSG